MLSQILNRDGAGVCSKIFMIIKHEDSFSYAPSCISHSAGRCIFEQAPRRTGRALINLASSTEAFNRLKSQSRFCPVLATLDIVLYELMMLLTGGPPKRLEHPTRKQLAVCLCVKSQLLTETKWIFTSEECPVQLETVQDLHKRTIEQYHPAGRGDSGAA